MSYPPPPGLDTSDTNRPAGLPAKPPPAKSAGFKPAFSFAPRSVAQTQRTQSPAQYSSPPVNSPYPQTSAPGAYSQPAYDAPPQIHNPFPAPGAGGASAYSAPANYDPEYEAQVAQWQSAYVSKDGEKPRLPGQSAAAAAAAAATIPSSRTDSPTVKEEAPKTVMRAGGGTTWQDPTLLEWDPAHFRIFVGNLAGEVTDESLLKAFSKYESLQKARVVRDKRSTKSKGYGFVSFKDGDDYFQAAREMQNKYIGSHPIQIKRAQTEVRPTNVQDRRNKHKNKNGKVEHGGIKKKGQDKTKNGLKILG